MAEDRIAEAMRAFRDLEGDGGHACRWRQGQVLAQLRDELGHQEGVKPFHERTGITYDELRNREDLHRYFELEDLDPSIPVVLYQIVATEFRRGEDQWEDLTGDTDLLGDENPTIWVRKAHRQEWSPAETKRRVRTWTGRQHAQFFARSQAAAKKTAGRPDVTYYEEIGLAGPERLLEWDQRAYLGEWACWVGGQLTGACWWGNSVLEADDGSSEREKMIQELCAKLRPLVREEAKQYDRLWEYREETLRTRGQPQSPAVDEVPAAESRALYSLYIMFTMDSDNAEEARNAAKRTLREHGAEEITSSLRRTGK